MAPSPRRSKTYRYRSIPNAPRLLRILFLPGNELRENREVTLAIKAREPRTRLLLETVAFKLYLETAEADNPFHQVVRTIMRSGEDSDIR